MFDAVMKNDMYAYESITDYITEQILFSDIPELEQVRMHMYSYNMIIVLQWFI